MFNMVISGLITPVNCFFFKDIFHALLNLAVTVLLEYLDPTNYNCSGSVTVTYLFSNHQKALLQWLAYVHTKIQVLPHKWFTL